MSLFQQYTNGVQPVTDVSKAGANIGQMYQQGIASMGSGLAEGIKQYYTNKAENEQITQEGDQYAQQLSAVAKMHQDNPEMGEMNDYFKEQLDNMSGFHGMSLAQKRGAVNSAKTALNSVAPMVQMQMAKNQMRLMQTMGDATASGNNTVSGPSVTQTYGLNNFDPSKSVQENINDFHATLDNANSIAQSRGQGIKYNEGDRKSILDGWIRNQVRLLNQSKLPDAQKARLTDALSEAQKENSGDGNYSDEVDSWLKKNNTANVNLQNWLLPRNNTTNENTPAQGWQDILQNYAGKAKQEQGAKGDTGEEGASTESGSDAALASNPYLQKSQYEPSFEFKSAELQKDLASFKDEITSYLEKSAKEDKDFYEKTAKSGSDANLQKNQDKPSSQNYGLGSELNPYFPKTGFKKKLGDAVNKAFTEVGLAHPLDDIVNALAPNPNKRPEYLPTLVGPVRNNPMYLGGSGAYNIPGSNIQQIINNAPNGPTSPQKVNQPTKNENELYSQKEAGIESQGNYEVGQIQEQLPKSLAEQKVEAQNWYKQHFGYVPSGFEGMWQQMHPEGQLRTMQVGGNTYFFDGKDWKIAPRPDFEQQRDMLNRQMVQTDANGRQLPMQLADSGLAVHGTITAKDADSVKNKLSDNASAIEKLDELNKMIDVNGKSFDFKERGKAMEYVENLKAVVRNALFPSGRVAEWEQEILKNIVPDPTGVLTLDSTTREKLKTLRQFIIEDTKKTAKNNNLKFYDNSGSNSPEAQLSQDRKNRRLNP